LKKEGEKEYPCKLSFPGEGGKEAHLLYHITSWGEISIKRIRPFSFASAKKKEKRKNYKKRSTSTTAPRRTHRVIYVGGTDSEKRSSSVRFPPKEEGEERRRPPRRKKGARMTKRLSFILASEKKRSDKGGVFRGGKTTVYWLLVGPGTAIDVDLIASRKRGALPRVRREKAPYIGDLRALSSFRNLREGTSLLAGAGGGGGPAMRRAAISKKKGRGTKEYSPYGARSEKKNIIRSVRER